MSAIDLIGMHVSWLAGQTHAEGCFLCRLGRLTNGLGLDRDYSDCAIRGGVLLPLSP